MSNNTEAQQDVFEDFLSRLLDRVTEINREQGLLPDGRNRVADVGKKYDISIDSTVKGQTRTNTYKSYVCDCQHCLTKLVKRFRGDCKAELLHYINHGRLNHGHSALQWNDEIARHAQWKADDMKQHGYFDHQTLSGEYAPYSEVLTKCRDAWSAFESWRTSGGHHDIMVDPRYTQVGIGHVPNDPLLAKWGNGADLWVAQFS